MALHHRQFLVSWTQINEIFHLNNSLLVAVVEVNILRTKSQPQHT